MDRRQLVRVSVLLVGAVAVVSGAACGSSEGGPLEPDAAVPDASTDASTSDVANDAPQPDAEADASPFVPACVGATGPVMLAELESTSSRIDANDRSLFMIGPRGGVLRVSKAGGPPTTISPDGVAVVKATNTHLCWGLLSRGTMCALADGGGATKVLPQTASDLWLSGTTVHYAAENSIGRMSVDGGDKVVLVDSPSPIRPRASVAPLGPWAVYGEGSDTFAIPNAGPDAAVTLRNGTGTVYEMVTDGTEMYWSERDSSPTGIWRTNGGVGGTPVLLVSAGSLDQVHVYGHAVDATHVYAVFRDGLTSGRVVRVPKGGSSAAATPIIDGLADAAGMAVDDSCIYYWARQAGDAGAKQGVWALRKPAP
ncbi:MAG: hypothetical protein JST00_20705 [Deltaproteobacteria bacterium]|nr:hypothetical protein [Deltaproteobacteria bacterium]